MNIFESNISASLINFFKVNLKNINSFEAANILLKDISGIHSFFNHHEEFLALKNQIEVDVATFHEPDRRAYGDFQTNNDLTDNITDYLNKEGVSPEFVIEPTCGKGRFIIAALKQFKTIKKIVGIEIYYPYIWETKFEILATFLKEKAVCKPEIEIIHADIFSFDLTNLAKTHQELNTLVIGNPPWVTNAELGALDSKNLPRKSNFKNHKGIDAITGKGNFDIGEYISLQLVKTFEKHQGKLAFLVKNSVVKNILSGQLAAKHHIGNIQKQNIDAKKEFNVSVDACLFLADFNSSPACTCQEIDFYTQEKLTKFGWHKNKFVYSINDYHKTENIDGKGQFVWRQGLKHDCSKIMELDRFNGHFINGYKQEVAPEKTLLYGLLKSSDLKNKVITAYRKTTIVTQKKIGQDTSYIKRDYPKTYNYLNTNRTYFDRRKSSIYKGKPPFSIFGIGDYSFAKYKVAISGMYKRTTFSLIPPENDKPIMLDDTCYFIGFDNLIDAKIAQLLLNSGMVQSFLKSIIFPDSKRSITKEVLMRIDLNNVYQLMDIKLINFEEEGLNINHWIAFEEKINWESENINQLMLF